MSSNLARIILYSVTLVVVVLALVAILFGNFRSFKSENNLRFCVTGIPVVMSSGKLDGMLELDSGAQSISYLFYYSSLSPILAINVRGPRLPGQDTAPVVFSLCGTVDVCDITTVPGQVTGNLLKLQPGQLPTEPQIVNIRSAPFKYYLEVLTGAHPTSPGELRAPLTSACGFAI